MSYAAQIKLSGRVVMVIVVLAVWSMISCTLLSRWSKVVNLSSIHPKPVEESPTGCRQGDAATLKLEAKTKTKTKAEADPRQSSDGSGTASAASSAAASAAAASAATAASAAVSQSSLGDELALRVIQFTGKKEEEEEEELDGRMAVGGVVRRLSTSGLTRQSGFDVISRFHGERMFDYWEVARYPLTDEYLTPLEKEILADGPLTDLTKVASPDTSQLDVVGLKTPGQLKVGDKVTVRVVLKDTQGRPVLKGGHQVRVWMVGKEKEPRSAAVDVTDLRNGTYLASVPVLWPGLWEVRAALQRPREFNKLALTLMDRMKMMNGIVASFVSGSKEEITMCSFIPVVPGYHQVCNLTALNGDLPWYCGRPSTPGIKCRHWAWSSYIAFPNSYPVSDIENTLLSPFVTGKTPCIRKLPGTIKLSAIADPKEGGSAPSKKRGPLKARDTWEDQAPRGYWENNEWCPQGDCQLPEMTSPAVLDCLHNTTVLTFGDSNVRRVMEVLQKWVLCAKQPDPQKSYHPNMLHVPLLHHCQDRNIWLSWYPHAYPFFTGFGIWSDVKVKDSLSGTLKNLPSTGKYVLIVHLYTHFLQTHTYVYVQHVREAVRAIRDLLRRNPHVKVFVRGPHAVSGTNFPLFADIQSERCLRVLKREFRDLRDSVVLLNGWDMTVASENCPIHPDDNAVQGLLSIIFQHICPHMFESR